MSCYFPHPPGKGEIRGSPVPVPEIVPDIQFLLELCSRHRSYTSSNLIYADGHLGTMGDEYDRVGDFPFRFR